MPSSQGGMAGLFNNLVDGLQGVEDRRNMAELAAGRFDAIGGDQAAYWAKSLRANPRAALGAAEKFGGFQSIETNLQGARARSQAMNPQNSPADMQRILFSQSPADAKTAAEMGYYGAHGNLYNAQAGEVNARTGMMQDMMGGGTGQPGQPGQPRRGPMDYLQQAEMYTAMGMTEEAGVVLRIREARRKPAEEQIKAFRAISKPAIQATAKMAEDWKSFRGRDFMNPANDAALTKLFIGGVEPGLQVTTAEGQSVIDAAESDVGAIGQRILKTLTPAGRFTPTTRRLMLEAVEKSFIDRSKAKLQFFDGFRSEIQGSMPDRPDAVSRSLIGESGPIELLNELIRTPYNFDAIGPPLGNTRIMPNSKDALEDGVVYETANGPGKWNSENDKFEKVK